MCKTPLSPILLSFAVSTLTASECQAGARYNLSSVPNLVDDRLAVQSINSREYDPFGLPQNPLKKLEPVDEEGGEISVEGEGVPQLTIQL